MFNFFGDFFGGRKQAESEQNICQLQDQLSEMRERLDKIHDLQAQVDETLQAQVDESRRQIDEITLSLQLMRETRFDEYQRFETFRNQVLNLFAKKGSLPEIVVLDVRTAPTIEWEMDSRFDVRILVGGALKQFSLVSYTTDYTYYRDRPSYRQYISEAEMEQSVLNVLADAYSLEEVVLKSMGCLPGDFYRIVEVNPDVPEHDLMHFEIGDGYFMRYGNAEINPEISEHDLIRFDPADGCFARYGNPEQATEEHDQSA